MAKPKIEESSDPKYPDKVTEEIAEKMKKEGHDMSAFENNHAAPETDDDEEEGDEEPVKKPEKKDSEKKPEPKKSDEDDEGEGKDEGKDDDDEEKPKPQRQVLIPIVRVKQREKQIRRETEEQFSQQVSDLTNQVKTLTEQVNKGKPADADEVEKLTELATQISTAHGTDPGLVTDLLKAVKQLYGAGVQIPSELKDAVSTIKAQQAKDAEARAQENERKETEQILNQFDDEYSSAKDSDGKPAGILNNPDVVKAIRDSGLSTDEFKERLQDLVLGEHGEKYAKLTLIEVFNLKRDELLPKKKKSAEGANGGRSTDGVSDADEDLKLPSPEEQEEMIRNGTFEAFSDKLAKRSQSRVMRRGRPIN